MHAHKKKASIRYKCDWCIRCDDDIAHTHLCRSIFCIRNGTKQQSNANAKNHPQRWAVAQTNFQTRIANIWWNNAQSKKERFCIVSSLRVDAQLNLYKKGGSWWGLMVWTCWAHTNTLVVVVVAVKRQSLFQNRLGMVFLSARTITGAKVERRCVLCLSHITMHSNYPFIDDDMMIAPLMHISLCILSHRVCFRMLRGCIICSTNFDILKWLPAAQTVCYFMCAGGFAHDILSFFFAVTHELRFSITRAPNKLYWILFMCEEISMEGFVFFSYLVIGRRWYCAMSPMTVCTMSLWCGYRLKVGWFSLRHKLKPNLTKHGTYMIRPGLCCRSLDCFAVNWIRRWHFRCCSSFAFDDGWMWGWTLFVALVPIRFWMGTVLVLKIVDVRTRKD